MGQFLFYREAVNVSGIEQIGWREARITLEGIRIPRKNEELASCHPERRRRELATEEESKDLCIAAGNQNANT